MDSYQLLPVVVRGVIPTPNGCALFLGTAEKTFIIHVDPNIGDSIRRAINNDPAERPLTHESIITLLNGLEAEVDRVVITHLDQGTFFARLIVSMENELGHKIVEIDIRPSDAIALASISDKPIYVTGEVLDKANDMTEVLEKILNNLL